MRIFLDTNVLASALATRGLCTDLLQRVIAEHELLIGRPVIDELRIILPRSFKLPVSLVEEFVCFLDDVGESVSEIHSLPVECPDSDDVPILGCALAANAELFVTGDKALLKMDRMTQMQVVTPRECWKRIERAKE